MYNGFMVEAGVLPLLSGAVTRSITAENPTGEPGRGGRATDGTGLNAARTLGRGWKVSPCVEMAPGETIEIANIEGPGAIQSIWMTAYTGRDIIIRIYWDDMADPSVECPESDFFACGWNDNDINPFVGPFTHLNSLMVCVNPHHGLNCFWNMPFQKRCRVALENRGEKARFVFYQINYVLTQVPDDIGYFHAQFRRVNSVALGNDYVILDGVRGKGQYVGTALSVGLNGPNLWWGEGEMKFFLDGDEKFPTICGTGTEDYFMGAFGWNVDGRYAAYNSLYAGMYYANQPDGTYQSQQRFSMYRWHVVDPIRFNREIKVVLQDIGRHRDGRHMPRRDDFASVAFWYQTLPGPKFPKLPAQDDLEVT